MSPQEHQLTRAQQDEVKRRLQDPPKPEIPPARTFKVARIVRFGDTTTTVIEGVEAHRLEEHPNGNISFYRYLEAHSGEQGVWYTFKLEKLLAAGSYYDIIELTNQFQLHTN